MRRPKFLSCVLFLIMAASLGVAADPPVKIKIVVPEGVEVEIVRVPVDPPPPPPDVAKGPFYFQVVRPDGPAHPAFTAIMRDPAWNTLRAAGHSVKDYTLTDYARAGFRLPAGTLIPTVVTLKVAADRKSSTVVVPARPLPTTGADILNLPPAPAVKVGAAPVAPAPREVTYHDVGFGWLKPSNAGPHWPLDR